MLPTEVQSPEDCWLITRLQYGWQGMCWQGYVSGGHFEQAVAKPRLRPTVVPSSRLAAQSGNNFADRAVVSRAAALEEALAWGFDVDAWRAHLNILSWPEARRAPGHHRSSARVDARGRCLRSAACSRLVVCALDAEYQTLRVLRDCGRAGSPVVGVCGTVASWAVWPFAAARAPPKPRSGLREVSKVETTKKS